MRRQLAISSIMVPRGTGNVVIGFDLGSPGMYGEIPLTPKQAERLASDLIGAAQVAEQAESEPRHHGLELAPAAYAISPGRVG